MSLHTHDCVYVMVSVVYVSTESVIEGPTRILPVSRYSNSGFVTVTFEGHARVYIGTTVVCQFPMYTFLHIFI